MTDTKRTYELTDKEIRIVLDALEIAHDYSIGGDDYADEYWEMATVLENNRKATA